MHYKFISYLHNLATFWIAILLLIFGWLFNNQTGWGIFYAIICFFFIELIQLILPLHSLNFKIKEQLVHPDDLDTTFKIRLWTKSWFLIPHLKVQLYYQQRLKGEGEINNHNFHKAVEVPLIIFNLPRGYYPQIKLQFIANDYFQIWEKCYLLKASTAIYVLPYNWHEAGQKLNRALLHFLKCHLPQQDFISYDFKEYRSYQGHDSLRTIDWKKTAKTGKLLVRENYPDVEQQNVLIFWGEAGDNFEATLSLFYSLIKVMNFHYFSEIIFLGKKDFYGKVMNDQWAALVQPFADRQNFTKLNHLRRSQIFLFTPFNSLTLKHTLSYVRKFNRVICLTYRTPHLVSISTEKISQNIEL